jgi:hypothetical protein
MIDNIIHLRYRKAIKLASQTMFWPSMVNLVTGDDRPFIISNTLLLVGLLLINELAIRLRIIRPQRHWLYPIITLMWIVVLVGAAKGWLAVQ